jgi:hypothetical protein
MSEVRRVSRLLIAAGLLALLTACESLPDEKALAVNDPAFDPAKYSSTTSKGD